jgi:two-component sensor histidine kinase
MQIVNYDWLERLPELRKNVFLSYGFAAAVFICSCVARWAIHDLLPVGVPYITFFIAVLLATLVGGLGPGIMVLMSSVVVAWFWWLPQATTAHVQSSITASVLFAVISGMIIYVVDLLNRTVERLLATQERAENQLYLTAMAEQQLAQLNGELRHRNKNTFSVLASLVAQTARHETDIAMFADKLRSRLSAMGSAQDLMISSQFRGVDLQNLLNKTVAPIVPPGENRFECSGGKFFLTSDVASPLALVIHELATNCVKYGAWSNEVGRVFCRWHVPKEWEDGASIVLTWRETGGPPTAVPERTGLGTVLIEKSLPDTTVERTFNGDGMVCIMHINTADATTGNSATPPKQKKSQVLQHPAAA